MVDRQDGIKIAMLLALLLGGLGLIYWHDISNGTELPPKATNIETLGNGWFEFDYKGSRYLYHSTGIGDHARESMVRLGPAKDNNE